MVWVADDLAAWLFEQLADAGRRKLTALVLGDELERALRQAATAAVQSTARELSPDDGVRAGRLAMAMSHAFTAVTPNAAADLTTVLEAVQAGVSAQLAVLEDCDLTTEPGRSWADVAGVRAGVMAPRLTALLLAEIVSRGIRGGPLFPLAAQLNADATHLQGQQIHDTLRQFGAEILAAISRIGALSDQAVATAAVGAGGSRHLGWSEYTEQVRNIAPPAGLLDRERELADMAAFCSGNGSYWWWRAGPWAGKSALMSWFVLHPPPKCAVVSFFVTARDASQDDSTAFATSVRRQLAELLGPGLSGGERTATDDGGYLRLLMREAARRYQEQGKSLVLVVDGLDEDRGADAGRPSIASLLPKDPAHGLKVLVTRRADPRLPADVPADHPLRDSRVAHVLASSGHALVIRDAAELELRALLNGTPAQRDLLGFLTSAMGGLTLTDLATLSGLAPFEVNPALRGVAGRTFTARQLSPHARADQDQVFLLAHELLQAEAARGLGGRLLAGYRDRLHLWAEEHHAAGWPATTPAYLLHGYFAMLRAAGDTERLIACAIDEARHDRLLQESGGDAAALAEISAAQDAILSQAEPDLTAMARLARHRDRLTGRNANLPECLPAVWAALGEPDRAEALARSAESPSRRALALTWVALALATDGARERALGLAAEANQAAAAEPEPQWRYPVLAEMSLLLADAGLHEAAALTADAAEAAARAVSLPQRAEALCCAVPALMAAGLPDRARLAAEMAEAAAGAGDDPEWLSDPALRLEQVAVAFAACGLAQRAEELARSADGPDGRGNARAAVAVMLADAGRLAQAELIMQHVTDPRARAEALARLSRRFADAGLHARGQQFAAEAQAIAHAADNPFWQAEVAAVLSQARWHHEAAQLAEKALNALLPSKEAGEGFAAKDAVRRCARAIALATVAQVLAVAGEHAPAARTAAHAQSMLPAGGILDPLQHVAAALTACGLLHRAEAVIEASHNSREHARALTSVAHELLKQGSPVAAARMARKAETAARLAAEDSRALSYLAGTLAAAGMDDRAEMAARSVSDPKGRAAALDRVATAQAAAGRCERAARLAADIPDPGTRVGSLVTVAAALAVRGLGDRAEQVAGLAITAASQIPADQTLRPPWRPPEHEGLRVPASQRLAAAGLYRQASEMARSITEPGDLAAALAAVAKELSVAGHHSQARDMAQSIPGSARRGTALVTVSQNMAAEGLYGQAEETARSITEPGDLAAALAAVAMELSVAGHHSQARDMAQSIPGSARRGTALVTVSQNMAAEGLYDQAEMIAGSLPSMHQRAEAWSGVARILASAGQHDRAVQAATQADISAASTANVAGPTPLPEVAAALLAAGIDERASQRADDAIDLARSRRGAYNQLVALVSAMQIFKAGGLGNHAARAAEHARIVVTSGELGPEPLRGAAGLLADCGFFDQAEIIAQSIASPVWQAGALTALAEKYVAAGSYERAESAIKSIADFGERARALATLARALAAAGQHSQAEAIARSFNHPVWQPAALESVANALAIAGNPARARHLIALTWTVGSWDSPLEELAAIAPAALMALSDEFTEQTT